MKKTAKVFAAILSLSALTGVTYAAVPGAYVGAGLGASNLETAKKIFNVQANGSQSRDVNRLAGRAFAGYNFNEFFGLEAGYARYGKVNYDANSKLLGGTKTLTSSLDYTDSAFDVVGKAYLPVGNGFNLYALGGVARVNQEVSFSNGGVPLNDNYAITAKTTTTHKFRPVYGLGASYDIPQTAVTTSLEVSRIQGSGNVKTSPSAIANADLVTFSVAYNFG